MKPHFREILKSVQNVSRFSIRTKITVFFALTIGLFTLLIAVYLPIFQQQRELEALKARAQSIAAITAFSIGPALLFEDRIALQEAIDAARQDMDILLLRVQNDSGRVVVSYPPRSLNSMLQASDSGNVSGYQMVAPITNQGSHIGTLTLVISTEKIRRNVSDTREAIAIVSFFIFIIGTFIGGWIGKLITAQLAAIAETTKLVAAGDLTRRVIVASKDEVGVFAHSFNLMVEKLESTLSTLADMNKDLERRVEDRTSALQHEIGERKKIEEQLRKLYIAVEQSSVSVAITDTRGTIEYVNPKFTSISGYSFEEAAGQSASLVKSGLTSQSVYKHLWETILAGKEWSGDVQNRRKNGELYWENVTISPIRDPNGTITHFLAVKEDITDKRKLEQQLVQAQKMESIGTLAGGIAHDFNNILGIITGFASLIGATHQREPETQKNVRMITTAVDRGANIVRQILTFARKTEARPMLVEVNALVQELSSLLKDTFPKTITIALNLEKALPRIVIDGTQLHQTLLNLCVNARDALANGGVISIGTTLASADILRTKFPEARQEFYVQISVSDTGTGMSPAVIQRIFEPFFTTKEIGKGTGLGLSVVYGIVNAHAGFVDVESSPGKGSTFRVYLPVQDEPDSEPDGVIGKSLMSSLDGNETILIVEDEESLRQMLDTVLRLHGYTTLFAKDGIEGVEAFKKNFESIDVLVTDIGLPRLDGLSMIKQIRLIKPKLKVLACSGFLNPELRAALAQEEISDFIQKPFQPEHVLERIRGVMSDSKA